MRGAIDDFGKSELAIAIRALARLIQLDLVADVHAIAPRDVEHDVVLNARQHRLAEDPANFARASVRDRRGASDARRPRSCRSGISRCPCSIAPYIFTTRADAASPLRGAARAPRSMPVGITI